MTAFTKSLTVFITLFSLSALAQTIQIPVGVKVEKHKYNYLPNNEPTSLSACGLHSRLTNEGVIQNLTLLNNSGPFYQYMSVNNPINLELRSSETSYSEGTDCNYQGFNGEDPDWSCSDEISGFWSTTRLTLQDSYGNIWHSIVKPAMVSDQKLLPTQAEAKALAVKSVIENLNTCSRF